MVKQVIRVPAILNDGAHRPVQEAVRRVNANFTELYDRAVSVKEFGAVGDGVTDDTAAFQSALNSLGQLSHANVFVDQSFVAGGGILLIPLGNYLITNTIYYASGQSIRGGGRGTLLNFKPSLANTDLFSLDPTRQTPASYKGVQISFSDFSVAGDYQAAIDVPGNKYARRAFNFTNVHFVTLKRLSIMNVKVGIYFSGVGYYHYIEDPQLYNCAELALHVADANAGQVIVIGGDTSRSGGFVSALGAAPDYAMRSLAQVTLIEHGMEMGTDVALGYLYEEGVDGCFNVVGGRIEGSTSRPLKVSDNPYHRWSRNTAEPSYSTGPLLKVSNWGVRAAGEDGSVPERRFPPHSAIGNPAPVILRAVDAEGYTVSAANFDLRKQFYSFVYDAGNTTATYDATETFCNTGVIKIVYNITASADIGLKQTLTYSTLTHYIGKRLYLCVVMKTENDSKFSYYYIRIRQLGGQTASFKRVGAGEHIVDYGNGYKLYVIDFLPNVDASGTDDHLEVYIYGNVTSTAAPAGTIYVAYCGLFEHGYPIVPVNVNPFDVYGATGFPTFSRYKSGFNPGDIISKYAPVAGDTPGWICTVAGGTFIPIATTSLAGSASWDPGSIAIGGMEAKDVAVTGAALGDYAVASFSLDVLDLDLSASVTATDVATAVLSNNTAGAVDLGSGTIKVKVIKV